MGHRTRSAGGRRLIAGNGFGTLSLLDASTGRTILEAEGHAGAVTDASFTPDGSRIVTVGQDGLARIWWPRDLRLDGILSHPVRLRAASVSADGSLLATADNDGVARVWDLSTGAMLTELIGHERWLTDVAISADGARVATASADGTARLWHSGGGIPVAELPVTYARTDVGLPNEMAVLSDETVAIVAGGSFQRVWDWRTDRTTRDIPRLEDGHQPWNLVASPDRSLLIIDEQDGVHLVEGDQHLDPDLGRMNRVGGGSFSADGGRLLIYGSHVPGAFIGEPTVEPVATVFDVGSGEPTPLLVFGDSSVRAGALSPDGATAALLLDRLVVIDTVSGSKPTDVSLGENEFDEVGAVSFSSDGRTLYVSGPAGELLVFDVADLGAGAAPAERWQTGHGALTAISTPPDGSFVATAGSDGVVRVWGPGPGRALVADFQAGESQEGLAFTKFAGPESFTEVDAVFLNDGVHLVTSAYGMVRVFACDACVPYDELLELARSRVTRGFTPDERAAYLGATAGQS